MLRSRFLFVWMCSTNPPTRLVTVICLFQKGAEKKKIFVKFRFISINHSWFWLVTNHIRSLNVTVVLGHVGIRGVEISRANINPNPTTESGKVCVLLLLDIQLLESLWWGVDMFWGETWTQKLPTRGKEEDIRDKRRFIAAVKEERKRGDDLLQGGSSGRSTSISLVSVTHWGWNSPEWVRSSAPPLPRRSCSSCTFLWIVEETSAGDDWHVRSILLTTAAPELLPPLSLPRPTSLPAPPTPHPFHSCSSNQAVEKHL